MTHLLRAGALSCALLASTALTSSPALAQEGNLAPPPENFVVSPGGVDMRSGRYAYSQTDLSIGADAGVLAFTRTLAQPVFEHNNPFGNFSHNWDILLSEKRINYDGNRTAAATATRSRSPSAAGPRPSARRPPSMATPTFRAAAMPS